MGPTPSDAEAQAAAVEILRGSAYARWRHLEASGDLRKAIADWLRGLDAWMYDLSIHQSLLYYLLIGGLLVIAALLLLHVVWSLRVALSHGSEGAPEPSSERAPSLLAEAEALAAAGRFLDAAHGLQLVTLELLLRRQLIALSRGDANAVLRERLRGAALPEIERRLLIGLIDRLEARWFRDRDNDAALYRDWHALHQRLRAGAEAA